MNIIQARNDPQLLASAFPEDTWGVWDAFLAALFALPMDRADRRTLREFTARKRAPTSPFREAYAIVGRRGGKSRIAALVAVFCACFREYVLARGEEGIVMVLASDRRQARVTISYVKGLLHATPLLEQLIAREGAEFIELTNQIRIEVHTSSFRAVRGYSVVCAVLDELAFWPSDEHSANPAEETIVALRPAMTTIPNALLLGISSPYARRGPLWEAFRRNDPQVLVWKAPSLAMNPSLDPEFIRREFEKDEARARAEYGAEFRADIESFISREAVEACVQVGLREQAPLSDFLIPGLR